jgi:hypothetical protein
MWVADTRMSVLSSSPGGGKWVELTISADPLYQHLLLTAEKKFWSCVVSGETPRLFWRRATSTAPGSRPQR